MQTGTVTTMISTADAAIPVSMAYVWICQGDDLISFQLTDENGKTGPVEIETPDRSESLSPNIGSTPFAVCNIHIYHPMYEPFEVKNAQVFAGVNTLQELSLVPLPEFSPAGDNLSVSNVTRQNL